MLRTNLLIGLAALAMTQLAWSGEATIKAFGPSGEDISNPAPADDHLVAVMTYEKTETTQLCGGPFGRTLMKITVRADGIYSGVETSSRLVCPGSGLERKATGLVRKALYSKHEGKLSMMDLAKLMDRLSQMTAQARDLAATSGGGYQTRIQLSADLRGVLSERDLQEYVQTGAAGAANARFMQAFILEGKIN